MGWQNIGYPDPSCSCGCSGSTVACSACSWPTALHLTTPFDVVTMTWVPARSCWEGCGSATLLRAPYPDPNMAAGDYLDYTFPGDTSGLSNPSLSGPVTIFYRVSCDCSSSKVRLISAVGTVKRSAGALGQIYQLPYDIASCSAAAVSGATTSATGAFALCDGVDARGNLPCLNATSFTDTANWLGAAALNSTFNPAGNFGCNVCSDSAAVCSPAFAQWSNVTIHWGTYTSWVYGQCNLHNGQKCKSVTNNSVAGSVTTGTYTLAP